MIVSCEFDVKLYCYREYFFVYIYIYIYIYLFRELFINIYSSNLFIYLRTDLEKDSFTAEGFPHN